MKNKFLILILLIFAQKAYSQVGSGSMLIGGSAQFQKNENADFQSLSLLPNVQYFLNDNLSVGGSLGFLTQRNNLEMIFTQDSIHFLLDLKQDITSG